MASAASRISRSPLRKTSTSPVDDSVTISSMAAVMPSIWSSPSAGGRYLTSTGKVRPDTSTMGASPKCSENRAVSMVAEVTMRRRSGRFGSNCLR